jgi:integrase
MSPIIERTYPNGTTAYGIRWTDETGVDRKRFSKKWTKTQARAALAKIEEQLACGIATRVDMTVTDLFHDWHAHHAMIHCTPAWQQDSMYQFRLRIEPLLGHRRIDDVNRRHINEAIRQMKAVMRENDPSNEYAGHATINKTLTVLKGMFTHAVAIEVLARNPIHGIPELTEEPQRQVTAWPLEVVHQVALTARRLPDELPEFQRSQQAEWIGDRNYALIMLAALTGLRQSEILGLRWEQIDEGWIHVTHKLCRRSFTRRETKSKRGTRRVPLVGKAAEILAEWRAVGAHDEIVFPNQSGDDHQRAEHFTNDAWTNARQATGVVKHKGVAHDTCKLTFHELRHTFVSTALAAGRDIWEVSHWAGDDPEVIKRVYGHYIPDSLGDTTRLDAAMSVGTRSDWLPPRP